MSIDHKPGGVRTGLYPRRKHSKVSLFQRSVLPYTWEKRWLWDISQICGICKLRIASWMDGSIDHIIPLSKGGRDSTDNMQLAHRSCNSAKGDSVE